VAHGHRHPAIADTVSSDHVPWTIIGASLLSCMVLLLSIRVMLARENKRRAAEPRDDSFDDILVVKIDEDGNRTEVKVSKVRVRFRWIEV
jgi:MFS transporter, ACS family, allantoate permease